MTWEEYESGEWCEITHTDIISQSIIDYNRAKEERWYEPHSLSLIGNKIVGQE